MEDGRRPVVRGVVCTRCGVRGGLQDARRRGPRQPRRARACDGDQVPVRGSARGRGAAVLPLAARVPRGVLRARRAGAARRRLRRGRRQSALGNAAGRWSPARAPRRGAGSDAAVHQRLGRVSRAVAGSCEPVPALRRACGVAGAAGRPRRARRAVRAGARPRLRGPAAGAARWMPRRFDRRVRQSRRNLPDTSQRAVRAAGSNARRRNGARAVPVRPARSRSARRAGRSAARRRRRVVLVHTSAPATALRAGTRDPRRAGAVGSRDPRESRPAAPGARAPATAGTRGSRAS